MKKLLLSTTFFLFSASLIAQSWSAQNTGFNTASRGINQIQIIDANTVWGLAYDGAGIVGVPEVQEFTRTLNGGATWTPGLIDIANPAWSINNLIPVSANIAWVSAIDNSGGTGSATPGGIWKTINGGSTWTQQNATAFIGSGAFLNGVHFWDVNEGIAFGDPVAGSKIECYKSLNGGILWTSVTTVPNMATGEYNYNNGNVFVGNSIWLPTNKGKILRSTDKGLTWTKLSTPLTDFGSAAVNGTLYFSDASNGVLLGTLDTGATYKLYTTANGGLSWITPTTNYAGGYNRLLSYVPGTNVIVACGNNGTAPSIAGSSFSSDNGLSFTTIDTGNQRGYVAMFSTSIGWASGFTSGATGGVFKLSGTLSNQSFSNNKLFVATPNPTTGFLNISGTQIIDQIIIYDILGKIVQNIKFNGVENTSLDISNLSAGTYVLKVLSDETSETIKILKQ